MVGTKEEGRALARAGGEAGEWALEGEEGRMPCGETWLCRVVEAGVAGDLMGEGKIREGWMMGKRVAHGVMPCGSVCVRERSRSQLRGAQQAGERGDMGKGTRGPSAG